MKVNNNGIKPSAANQTQSREVTTDLKAKNNKDSAASALELAGSAKVNMSERAQMMAKAKEIAMNTSVDEAKVARLQKLIDEGKYKIDSEAVASRLVDEHLSSGE